MSALNAALCRCGIILWLAVLLASRFTHSAPVYDQDTTQVAEYDGAAVGCYFNFQRYQEGDRIITSEPCLNCTCHNRMLMCYLKVCPFTKAIGQDCTVEKRPDQCCPVITCPEVPVQLLTSTTSAPATSGSEIGFHDNYGCNVDERFYPDGVQLPVDHRNPCELCYCIRNRTTCVMQECTLQVAGCKPVYQPGVCCPIKYNCDYDEELSTTVAPTTGLIMTTTLPPGVLPQCYYEGKMYEDGESIQSIQPCQHCYCFRGEIACAVQNCGTPMQAHGKNCTAIPPPEGECCPTTYECDEDGQRGVITLPRGEEQVPEQVPHDFQMTPTSIDQEQQVTEQPQEESFPGADNAIPHEEEAEEEGVQGTIEHITEGYITSTEKSEEVPATLPEENIIPESETIAPHEHVTEVITSPETITEEAVTPKLPFETEAESIKTPTAVEETEESSSEKPTVELPATSSVSEGLQPEEEIIITPRTPEEHISTEENIIEKEHGIISTTEEERSTQTSISDETQTESITKSMPEEGVTSQPEELPMQVPEEVTEVEKVTEEEQVSITEMPERPEISTEVIEKVTSPIVEVEHPGSSIIPESVTELTKEDEGKIHPTETTPGEILATETESPIEQATATATHEVSSTEKTAIEEEVHPTEIITPEEIPSTEVNISPEERPTEGQLPAAGEGEGEPEQKPEEPSSEHAIVEQEQATVGAKKEDGGLTEATPAMSEEPVTEEKQHEEKVTPEIPTQGPTGIPIPERVPEQKAEDETVYYVTENVTHPEIISPDNLVTEPPQKQPTTYLPADQETTSAIAEQTVKPIQEEITEENLPTQKEPSVIEVTTEHKEITSTSIEVESSSEPSATTIAQTISEEKPKEAEKPTTQGELETEIQSTEAPSEEELPTKGLTFDESGESSSEEVSSESTEKEQPSEEEAGTQPPVATESEAAPETPAPVPAEQEHPTELPIPGKEQLEGERVTIAIPPAEQSTHIPQTEEKETEVPPVEEEKPIISDKPTEEHITEKPIESTSISSEEEKEQELEEQTTEAIQTVMEVEEKLTTQKPIVEEEKTEKQPEQPSTEEIPGEVAVTEIHGPQETEAPIIEEIPETTESTKGVSTEDVEHTEPTITEEERPAEMETTEMVGIEQTELSVPTEYSTEKIKEGGEEKISVSVSTEEAQTEVTMIKIEATEIPVGEKKTEEKQTEPSITEEHVSTQPSITDRKEDQEPIEQKPGEEKPEGEIQITEKPKDEEPEKQTISPEEEATYIPLSEESVTQSIQPEEALPEGTTTVESIGAVEGITKPIVEEQPEIPSKQPEEVASTEPSGQEEETHGTEKPEIHIRKETETPTSVTSEEYVTPTSAVSEETVKEEEGTFEGTTKPTLISEATTKLPVKEHTEYEGEIPTDQEIMTESVPSEEEAQKPTTQSPMLEEKPSEEKGEIETVPVEASTEEVAISETPEVSIEEQKPEDEISKEATTKMPIHEQEEYSTVAPEEAPETKVTEVPSKEIPEYSTVYPTSMSEEVPVEEETTSEIIPRPAGIPGEGNCLVEGQSYNNNSAVPPANACQTSCRCVSSIVQCELVQCPAPPAHLSNCMPLHTRADLCCPMYACDVAPTVELEADSHMIESHTPEMEEEGKKPVSPVEVSTVESIPEVTEEAKESSTLTGEIGTPESLPAEITVPSVSESEEETTIFDKQQTTLKPVDSYEQPTTIKELIEEHPEEHTVSPVSSTSLPEEAVEQTEPQGVSEETTESKISKEGEASTSTEQALEQTTEEHTPVSGEEQQVITSTHAVIEPHGIEEEGTVSPHIEEETTPIVTKDEETSVSIGTEKITTSAEREEEITTILAVKEEETTVPSKEEEKPIEEKGIEEPSTLKPIEEVEKKYPEEETIMPSEEPIEGTVEEASTMKAEEPIIVLREQTEKPEVEEEQKTIKPTEFEGTTIPEITSTIEHKPEDEDKHEEEKEKELLAPTEAEQAAETEEPETHIKLPVYPSELETQKPSVPAIESSTLIPDHTVAEEIPSKEHTTPKLVEIVTEESKGETEMKLSTEIPAIEEHVTIPVSPIEIETPSGITEQELEKADEEITEGAIPEISPETESSTGIESTEHAEEHTEFPTEHGKEPFVTKLPEEKPSEPISPEISTEQSVGATEEEKPKKEQEKPTESTITHEPESTQVSIEEHPEVTSEIESHTTESVSPAEEHTVSEKIPTTSATVQEEAAEQPVTPEISKAGQGETEQPVVSEVDTKAPAAEEEHVTVSIEEHTPKSEEQPVEEQTITSSTPTETETPESATSQEEQLTEKTIESTQTETELPVLIEKETVAPKVPKESEEEQKTESSIIEEPSKEEAVTEGKEETMEEVVTEEAVTHIGTTEKQPSVEEHTEQEEITPSETEPSIKVQTPVISETTTVLTKEQEPEEKVEVMTSEVSPQEHPVSEEATTMAGAIPERQPTTLVETEEKEAYTPEYPTTVSTLEEEISKPVTKVSIKEEFITTESATEEPGEPVTKISLPAEISVKPEQETESTEKEQSETTMKTVEAIVTEEIEIAPEAPSEIGKEEEIHPTVPTIPVETTLIDEEEQPSITKVQPEGVLPSEEGTPAPEEIQPTEGEEAIGLPEEPKSTEHPPETTTVETEKHPEIEQTSSEATVPAEYPFKVSGVSTELPEEKIPVEPISSQETEAPEESPQATETSIEQHVTKIGAPAGVPETTEQISEEVEEASRPHIDHFPEPTEKPEHDYSVEGELTLGSDEEHLRPVNHTMETAETPYQPDFHERPITTLAPQIPEYPDQSVSGEENPHFPMEGGSYLNPDEDYDEDDQAVYGPGTCRYGGKVYVSAQQIPRDDPCDFCFCFRSDIICLQQSCPPPIPGCHEEPISGFCCPRYECPVSMATALNLTTTTTTTTTTLPPHFHSHAYKGAARRSGCQIRGQAYRVGEVIKSASGPCLHCTCGGDGNMKCDPRVCSPEPMLRQMIAAATAKRRR